MSNEIEGEVGLRGAGCREVDWGPCVCAGQKPADGSGCWGGLPRAACAGLFPQEKSDTEAVLASWLSGLAGRYGVSGCVMGLGRNGFVLYPPAYVAMRLDSRL
ncbi:MAG: hypothetical protein IJO87_00290 [Eggerthellaceae bacterium]|nr:hypothetical protein [Eggerthellaceae bacterium]